MLANKVGISSLLEKFFFLLFLIFLQFLRSIDKGSSHFGHDFFEHRLFAKLLKVISKASPSSTAHHTYAKPSQISAIMHEQ